MPSSLTLRTGPKWLAASAAVVRAPSAVVEAGQRRGVVAQDRAEGQQAAVAVGGQGAVEAGQRLEHRRGRGR